MRIAKPLVKTLRVVAVVILVPVGIVFASILLWFASNLFDERLTPAATALLAPSPDRLQAGDDIFSGFVGFDAPRGQSMMKVGEARIDAYNRAAARTFGGSSADKLTFKGDARSLSWLTGSIWSTAKTHHAEIVALVSANRELYQRYLSLHELRGYFDSARPGVATPFAYIPPAVQQLFLADVAMRVRAGTPSQQNAALADLEQDIRMWKAVIQGEGGLFSKVMAAISLHGDLLLLGDMVTDPDFDPAPFNARWPTLLTPFALGDWKIGSAYPWEMRYALPTLEAIARADAPLRAPDESPEPWSLRLDDRVSAHFVKLNATENLEALRIERLRALADGDPRSFIERRTAYRAWERQQYSPATRSWYNPMGRVLLAAEPLDDDYPARLYDVAAFQRLVFLAYQIRLQCIGSGDVAAFMTQHPQWSTHPVGAKPFYFDPAKGELGVSPVGENARKVRFSLKSVGFAHCPRS